MTQGKMIEVMRAALGEIARSRVDCGKPNLTRRDMQTRARQALVECGYATFTENVTGRAQPAT